MINYRGISEIAKNSFIKKLEFFDDEFFVIMKNNRPYYLAFPTIIAKNIEKQFNLDVKNISAEYIKKELLENYGKSESLHLIRDGKLYYIFVSFEPEIFSYAHQKLIDIISKIHYNELMKTKNSIK